jgi:hypothetical protein
MSWSSGYAKQPESSRLCLDLKKGRVAAMLISVEGKFGILLGLIGLAGAGAIMIAPEHTEIGWTLIVVAVVGGGFLAYHHFSTSPRSERIESPRAITDNQNPPPSDKPLSPDLQERIFVGESITAEYLMGLFSIPGRTSFQARTDANAFMGKWMKVSGVMRDVSMSDPTQKFAQMVFKRDENIKIDDPLYFATLYMMFRNGWIQRALILRPGDKITVIGQIERVDAVSLQLTNCELIDPGLK